jgi:Phosphopantetheine attachment site
MGVQAVGPALPLMEQGLDSLAAVELRNAAAVAFGVQLGAAVALDHPTLEVAICVHIWSGPAAMFVWLRCNLTDISWLW